MNENQALAKPKVHASTTHLPEFFARVVKEARFDNGSRKVHLHEAYDASMFMGLSACIEAHERTMRPATSRERTACFLELASVYPARDGGEAVQQVRFEAYHDALKHLPADILRDACKHCIATQKFFPMPAEILVAAESSFAARAITTSRLKALRDYQLVDPEHYVALSEDERRRRTKMIHAAKTSFADGADVTAILQTENRLSQTVVKLEMEPEVGDLATALLRARVSADGAGHLDMDFAKTVAISDARAMWIYLKARGWRSMEGEAE